MSLIVVCLELSNTCRYISATWTLRLVLETTCPRTSPLVQHHHRSKLEVLSHGEPWSSHIIHFNNPALDAAAATRASPPSTTRDRSSRQPPVGSIPHRIVVAASSPIFPSNGGVPASSSVRAHCSAVTAERGQCMHACMYVCGLKPDSACCNRMDPVDAREAAEIGVSQPQTCMYVHASETRPDFHHQSIFLFFFFFFQCEVPLHQRPHQHRWGIVMESGIYVNSH